MFFKALVAAVVVTGAFAQDPSPPDALEGLTIYAPDNSFQASFMRRGATLTNFWVPDKNGNYRDIILGFDDHTHYVSDDLGHPYFGPVVGRYANRIRNGTFTIPTSKWATGPGDVYHVPLNENNLTDTLHGGLTGYDRRNWTLTAATNNSLTFNLTDVSGNQGFPGTVHAGIHYELASNLTFKINMYATSDEDTPILMSCHHYWNLEAYQESQNLTGHMAMIKSPKVTLDNGYEIPMGTYIDVAGTPLDFNTAKSIGETIPQTAGKDYCGTNCTGIDNCFIYDKPASNSSTSSSDDESLFSIWSVNSGIKMDVTTNQAALQMYTCNGLYNASTPIPRKASQGGPSEHYPNYSCVVLEQENIIDAINNPEYGADEIYGPGRDYVWEAVYKFSASG